MLGLLEFSRFQGVRVFEFSGLRVPEGLRVPWFDGFEGFRVCSVYRISGFRGLG
jgi:hypothetical protein